MKAWWTAQAARVDALNLRERVFAFVALIACALVLADSLWISPAQANYQQVAQRLQSQAAELQRLRIELAQVAAPVDSGAAVRADLNALQAQIDAVNARIAAVAPKAEGGPAIDSALEQFLKRHPGLSLLRTATLPAPPAHAALQRRGLELVVSGSYADLQRLVASLESALPALRWGGLQLKVVDQRPQLTLQVYVLGTVS